MPSGCKTFVLEYRPGGGGRGVSKKRLTLGRYGSMTAEQGKQTALEALARIRMGEDPQDERGRQRAALTVSGLIDAFIAGHVDRKKRKTAIAHKAALERLRAAHGSLKAEALTKAHIAIMHDGMTDIPYAANRFLAVISKCFAWSATRGIVPEQHINPARKVDRYKETSREVFDQ